MSDITWKFTQKQKEANRRAGHWQEGDWAWWPRAKASKDYRERLPHSPDNLLTLAILEQCSGHTTGHTTHGQNWTVLVS